MSSLLKEIKNLIALVSILVFALMIYKYTKSYIQNLELNELKIKRLQKELFDRSIDEYLFYYFFSSIPKCIMELKKGIRNITYTFFINLFKKKFIYLLYLSIPLFILMVIFFILKQKSKLKWGPETALKPLNIIRKMKFHLLILMSGKLIFIIWLSFYCKKLYIKMQKLLSFFNNIPNNLIQNKKLKKIDGIQSIQWTNLKKRYDNNELYQKKGITGLVKSKEICFIIGPSGTGKSTFIKAIMGIIVADSGDIIINGINQKTIHPNSLVKNTWYISQKNKMIPGITIKENLTLNKKITEKQILKALEKAGLKEVILKRKRHLDTKVEFNQEKLSGGEQRRLQMARYYLHNSLMQSKKKGKEQLCIFDEPTAGLDIFSARECANIIKDITIKNNQITFIITHNNSLVKYMEESKNGIAVKIQFCDSKKIWHFGSYSEVMKKSSEFKSLMN